MSHATAQLKSNLPPFLYDKNLVKLDSNENPLGVNQAALRAAQQALDNAARYPDDAGRALKKTITGHLGVKEEQITLGSGSSEIIRLLVQAFADSTADVITSHYSFILFKILAAIADARIITVPLLNWRHDLEQIAAAITPTTKLIYIDNPGNPIGTAVTHTELEAFLRLVPPAVVVIIDEAYYEYAVNAAYPKTFELQQHYPNVVVLRTFSKAYGLAGFRIGYGISSPEIAEALQRIKTPYAVNSVALAAAQAVLGDSDYLARVVKVVEQGRIQLQQAFQKLSLKYIPSRANFITFDLQQNARSFYENLLRRGISIRPLENYGLPTHLRVSVGLPHENEAFIEGATELIKEH